MWWAEASQVCWNKHLGQRGGAPSRTSTVRRPVSEPNDGVTLADAELARRDQILETLWWECEREGLRGWVELWGG